MADKVQELLEAAHGVLPYLTASTDPYDLYGRTERFKLSAGDRLRKEAEEADKKDAAILRFREALADFAAQVD